MLKRFFTKLFTRQKWETVYITQDVELYARIRGKLIDNNISVRTKFLNQNTGHYSLRNTNTGRVEMTTIYEILVKKEEFYIANKIVHNQ